MRQDEHRNWMMNECNNKIKLVFLQRDEGAGAQDMSAWLGDRLAAHPNKRQTNKAHEP
jgi:hypothetical protein